MGFHKYNLDKSLGGWTNVRCIKEGNTSPLPRLTAWTVNSADAGSLCPLKSRALMPSPGPCCWVQSATVKCLRGRGTERADYYGNLGLISTVQTGGPPRLHGSWPYWCQRSWQGSQQSEGPWCHGFPPWMCWGRRFSKKLQRLRFASHNTPVRFSQFFRTGILSVTGYL